MMELTPELVDMVVSVIIFVVAVLFFLIFPW